MWVFICVCVQTLNQPVSHSMVYVCTYMCMFCVYANTELAFQSQYGVGMYIYVYAYVCMQTLN